MKTSAPYIFKKIYNSEDIFENDAKELKLGYININDLLHKRSIDFVNNDKNLLMLDYLVIADTRLSKENETTYLQTRLNNWDVVKRFDSDDGLRHMGLIFLKSSASDLGDIVNNISVFYQHMYDPSSQIL